MCAALTQLYNSLHNILVSAAAHLAIYTHTHMHARAYTYTHKNTERERERDTDMHKCIYFDIFLSDGAPTSHICQLSLGRLHLIFF